MLYWGRPQQYGPFVDDRRLLARYGCALLQPKELAPDGALAAKAREMAERYGARLTISDDVATAVKGMDYIHTDVWVSMVEPAEVWDERVKLLKPYQVNAAMFDLTGNLQAKLMHCLPAFHNLETRVGEDVYQKTGMDDLEVTEEVFESPRSLVFDQAENGMHTIKAIMVATLGD